HGSQKRTLPVARTCLSQIRTQYGSTAAKHVALGGSTGPKEQLAPSISGAHHWDRLSRVDPRSKIGDDGAHIRVAHRNRRHLGTRDAFDDVAHQFVVGCPMLPLPGRQVRPAATLGRVTMTGGAFFDK